MLDVDKATFDHRINLRVFVEPYLLLDILHHRYLGTSFTIHAHFSQPVSAIF